MTSFLQKMKTHALGMTVERWLQLAIGVWMWIATALLILIDEAYYTPAFSAGISWVSLALCFAGGMLFIFLPPI